MNDLSYKKWSSMTNDALMGTIGNYVKGTRLNQNKSQQQVAEAAGLSRSTLSLLERGENIALSSLLQILRTLDVLHFMNAFLINNEISPIEYAKLQRNKRQRARNKGGNAKSNDDLGW